MNKTCYALAAGLSILALAACQQHTPFYPRVDLSPRTGPQEPCDPEIIYFEKDVLPVLLSSCAYSGCHDAQSREEGVVLDNYENTLRTGGVSAFDPGGSELYEVLVDHGDDIMPPPPEAPLDQASIDIIRDWIGQGAANYFCKSCDTAAHSFELEIRPMVERYCERCHSGSNPDGGVLLTNYAEIKASAEDGSLLGTITATGGFPAMPPGGSISDCETDQLRKWLEEGANNN